MVYYDPSGYSNTNNRARSCTQNIDFNENIENQNNDTTRLTAGKNVKEHYISHKSLLEKLLGKKYPRWKESNTAEAFLKDLSNMIDDDRFQFVYKSTAEKGGEILNIYKGEGLVVATKTNNEWVTLLEDGKGMAIQFEMFKILDD